MLWVTRLARSTLSGRGVIPSITQTMARIPAITNTTTAMTQQSYSRRVILTNVRHFSSSTPETTPTRENPFLAEDTFEAKPPAKLTTEMIEGIADTTQFFIRHGVSQQRLQLLAQNVDMPVVMKWQQMMQIFLMTQVHVIAAMGYSADEQGLGQYAHDLASCLAQVDPELRETFAEMRKDTWRELVATCFQLEPQEIPSLTIVDARNLMHKIASKMMEPDVLMRIQREASKIQDEDPELEVAYKHQVLQDIIVNHVYLGGEPSLVEQAGFGTGPKAYAKIQCAMSDHEGDPLVAEYAGAAMIKIWKAAGLDIESIQSGNGNSR